MNVVERFVIWTDRVEEHRLQRGVAVGVLVVYSVLAAFGLWWLA